MEMLILVLSRDTLLECTLVGSFVWVFPCLGSLLDSCFSARDDHFFTIVLLATQPHLVHICVDIHIYMNKMRDWVVTAVQWCGNDHCGLGKQETVQNRSQTGEDTDKESY